MEEKINISDRKKQIIELMIKDRKDILVAEKYGCEMLGYESEDLIDEELQHLKEIGDLLNK